jgi:two-component system sensor histidine kinase YesM
METRIKKERAQELEHNITQLIDSKANEIGSWMNQRISEIRIINENPSIKSMDFSEIKPYLAQLNEVLRGHYGNPNETFAIGGMDGQGWVNDEITIDVSGREYFKKAMTTEQEYVISKPIVSKSDQRPVFILCYPVLNERGEKVGFINGSVNMERFSKLVSTIDLYEGFTWIMNRNREIYSSDPASRVSEYVSGESLSSIIEQGGGSPSGTLVLENGKKETATVYYSSIPYTQDWILCTLIEDSMLYEQTDTIIRSFLMIGLLLFIISIFPAAMISNSIVKPIQSLKSNMIEVSQGNLQSYSDLQTGDEVSILGQVFNQMLGEIENLINQVVSSQKQKRQAEFRALQSQINPHFLYNTLDTLQWKALEYNAFEVADLVNSLSRFFRISLNGGREYIPIEEEVEHARTYLEIQKVRYREKILYSIEAGHGLHHEYVPKLIIQPLVENAIYHGLKPKRNGGEIHISVTRKENFLHLEVRDNGVGMTEEKLNCLNEDLKNSIESDHYGLYNINERLKTSFGEDYQILVESKPNKGSAVLLRIPVKEEGCQCIES